MQKIEYRTTDRSKWGSGPWDQEPDKVQWKDEQTGLPCLMVRNHGGAWCGYVGVSEGHPLFAKEYSACVFPEKHDDHEAKDDGWHYNCSPQGFLSAHGGITFANFCSTHTEEDFTGWQKRMEDSRAEAAKYPIGDAARRLREWAHVLTDYTAWKEKCQAVGICHLPEAGEPERVWWFGFDCSHSGDVSPGYERSFSYGGDSYKDADYVRSEVAALAKQLAALPPHR